MLSFGVVIIVGLRTTRQGYSSASCVRTGLLVFPLDIVKSRDNIMEIKEKISLSF